MNTFAVCDSSAHSQQHKVSRRLSGLRVLNHKIPAKHQRIRQQNRDFHYLHRGNGHYIRI